MATTPEASHLIQTCTTTYIDAFIRVRIPVRNFLREQVMRFGFILMRILDLSLMLSCESDKALSDGERQARKIAAYDRFPPQTVIHLIAFRSSEDYHSGISSYSYSFYNVMMCPLKGRKSGFHTSLCKHCNHDKRFIVKELFVCSASHLSICPFEWKHVTYLAERASEKYSKVESVWNHLA